MHPLSTFPQILFLGAGLSPLVLRLFVGILGIWYGWKISRKPNSMIGFAYGLLGITLTVGFYTQISAILSMAFLIFDFQKNSDFSKERKILYVGLVVILFSLLFTGPGFMAMDMAL